MTISGFNAKYGARAGKKRFGGFTKSGHPGLIEVWLRRHTTSGGRDVHEITIPRVWLFALLTGRLPPGSWSFCPGDGMSLGEGLLLWLCQRIHDSRNRQETGEKRGWRGSSRWRPPAPDPNRNGSALSLSFFTSPQTAVILKV